MNFENLDLTNIVTPVDPDALERLLVLADYDAVEREFVGERFL